MSQVKKFRLHTNLTVSEGVFSLVAVVVVLLLNKYRREFFIGKLKTRVHILVFIFLSLNANEELMNVKGLYHRM